MKVIIFILTSYFIIFTSLANAWQEIPSGFNRNLDFNGIHLRHLDSFIVESPCLNAEEQVKYLESELDHHYKIYRALLSQFNFLMRLFFQSPSLETERAIIEIEEAIRKSDSKIHHLEEQLEEILTKCLDFLS